jgi:hypothetical protein
MARLTGRNPKTSATDSACSIRVYTTAFERIWRIVRNPKSVKFFVFNIQHWSESHPLRHLRSLTLARRRLGWSPGSPSARRERNALNSSAVLDLNEAYDPWQTPLEIIVARFYKFSVQFDFLQRIRR